MFADHPEIAFPTDGKDAQETDVYEQGIFCNGSRNGSSYGFPCGLSDFCRVSGFTYGWSGSSCARSLFALILTILTTW